MRAGQVSRFLTAAFVLVAASSAYAADDGAWTVSKSSGEVWLSNASAQPASLKQEEILKPGDTIRTGRNGRVLLKRGEESMMISPNSVVGVPAEKKEGLSTTIVQQAGSILLEVEKRNVKHFEVETPYLAAVVKGTQFRVTVNATSTSVDVLRGQVEVADFRTGQIAQVKPGQHATTFSHGNGGLSLGGTGTLSPIEQGKPRTPSIERVPVPRAGLTAPRNTAIGQAVQSTGHGPRASLDKASPRQAGVAHVKPGVVRISSSIGEVKLNVHKVTHGLARDKSSVNAGNAKRRQQGHDLGFVRLDQFIRQRHQLCREHQCGQRRKQRQHEQWASGQHEQRHCGRRFDRRDRRQFHRRDRDRRRNKRRQRQQWQREWQ